MMEPKEPTVETNYIWNATFSSTSEADVKTFINEHKEDLMKLNDFVFGLNCDNTVSAEKDNRISIRVVRQAYSIDSCKEIAEKVKEQFGIDADKRKIVVDDIKQFGTYEFEVKLYQGISAKLYVMVGE